MKEAWVCEVCKPRPVFLSIGALLQHQNIKHAEFQEAFHKEKDNVTTIEVKKLKSDLDLAAKCINSAQYIISRFQHEKKELLEIIQQKDDTIRMLNENKKTVHYTRNKNESVERLSNIPKQKESQPMCQRYEDTIQHFQTEIDKLNKANDEKEESIIKCLNSLEEERMKNCEKVCEFQSQLDRMTNQMNTKEENYNKRLCEMQQDLEQLSLCQEQLRNELEVTKRSEHEWRKKVGELEENNQLQQVQNSNKIATLENELENRDKRMSEVIIKFIEKSVEESMKEFDLQHQTEKQNMEEVKRVLENKIKAPEERLECDDAHQQISDKFIEKPVEEAIQQFDQQHQIQKQNIKGKRVFANKINALEKRLQCGVPQQHIGDDNFETLSRKEWDKVHLSEDVKQFDQQQQTVKHKFEEKRVLENKVEALEGQLQCDIPQQQISDGEFETLLRKEWEKVQDSESDDNYSEKRNDDFGESITQIGASNDDYSESIAKIRAITSRLDRLPIGIEEQLEDADDTGYSWIDDSSDEESEDESEEVLEKYRRERSMKLILKQNEELLMPFMKSDTHDFAVEAYEYLEDTSRAVRKKGKVVVEKTILSDIEEENGEEQESGELEIL